MYWLLFSVSFFDRNGLKIDRACCSLWTMNLPSVSISSRYSVQPFFCSGSLFEVAAKSLEAVRGGRYYSVTMVEVLLDPLVKKESWAKDLLLRELQCLIPASVTETEFRVGLINLINKGRGTNAEDVVIQMLLDTASNYPDSWVQAFALKELANIIPFSNRSDKWNEIILRQLIVLQETSRGDFKDLVDNVLYMLTETCALTPKETKVVQQGFVYCSPKFLADRHLATMAKY